MLELITRLLNYGKLLMQSQHEVQKQIWQRGLVLLMSNSEAAHLFLHQVLPVYGLKERVSHYVFDILFTASQSETSTPFNSTHTLRVIANVILLRI